MKSSLSELKKINEIEILENIDLTRFTTIRLHKNGTLIKSFSLESTVELIKKLNDLKIDYHLVGWGANQVLHNVDDTLLIKLEFEFNREILKEVHSEYILPASVPLNILTSHAMKFGLKGWEVFTGIPASVGGAVFMNAGTSLGEIGSVVKEVQILTTDGKIRVEKINKNSFSYRKNNFLKDGEVILFATLIHQGIDEAIKTQIKEYLDFRKRTQPLTSKNCGCAFKNFDDVHKAGQFIDACGLKGLSINGLRVSHLHANFIENIESATSEDFIELTDLIKYELELFSGIEFELEAKVY